MKVTFDTKGNNFIDISPADNNKIRITLSAHDNLNIRSTIVNSTELTLEQLEALVGPLGFKRILEVEPEVKD